MGLFDAAKSAVIGNRGYRAHVDGNKLAGEGKVAQAREKYSTALTLYAEAARLGNNAPNILQAYSLLLMREGEFDRARDVMQGMSKLKHLSDEDWFQLRIQYSIYHWATGDVDRAIETIERAAAHRMNGSIYGTLGMYWVEKARQTGDFAPALEFNQKAMEYDDEDASTLDNMGRLYELMSQAEGAGDRAAEDRARAIKYYKKAHAQKPRQITTLYYLANMLHQDGDDAEARELLSNLDTLYISALCPVTPQMMSQLAREIG